MKIGPCIVAKIVLTILHYSQKKCFDELYIDLTIKVISRVLTRYFYSHTGKMPPPLADIIRTNLLTKYNEKWTITCDFKSVKKHVFHQIGTIVKNFLTNFHEYSTNNITSKVFTKTGGLTRKTITLPGNEVFNQPQPFRTRPRYHYDTCSDHVTLRLHNKCNH
ncbi:hypothetical protein DPMN_062097 [Dreissena polymorpha]|uniref:Uncharacterized protein n=1 Tax=Dreissena polymorpha TaxID=45954 RepID=A0A9D4C924_DREPO|nr:hypothetical protein DPMN_062097 [Dreissena polymorpha]